MVTDITKPDGNVVLKNDKITVYPNLRQLHAGIYFSLERNEKINREYVISSPRNILSLIVNHIQYEHLYQTHFGSKNSFFDVRYNYV